MQLVNERLVLEDMAEEVPCIRLDRLNWCMILHVHKNDTDIC